MKGVAAHQHLRRSSILARILPSNDLSSASLSLIENLQREELNPIEEAMGYQSLIADFQLSQQEVPKEWAKAGRTLRTFYDFFSWMVS